MSVAALLQSLGSPDFSLDAAKALDERSGRAVVAALTDGSRLGPRDANGRAVFEDLEAVLITIARAHPNVLLEAVTPELKQSFAFVSALCAIPDERAGDILVELLGAKTGAIRWLAFRELVRRNDARVAAALPKALKDRDSILRFEAVQAAARLGDASLLPRLREMVASPKTAPGTKKAAEAAILAIEAR